MKNFRWWSTATMGILSIMATIVLTTPVTQTIRAPIILVFLIFCPGLSIVRVINIPDRISELVLAIALSLSIETGIAVIMVMTGKWHPDSAVLVLASLTIVIIAIQTYGHCARNGCLLNLLNLFQ